ncbi:hypothetical protein GCM10025774_09760 [Microbacterium kyungheense]
MIPAATTRTSSSLSTGEGTGRDAAPSASGAPGARTTIARISAGGAATGSSGGADVDRSDLILIANSLRGRAGIGTDVTR